MSESEPVPGQEIPPPPPAGRTSGSEARSSGTSSALIAAGILLSRLLGLVRQALMARYLGAGWVADAFNAAFKIPNMLQNLFGEGALSAAFIPVYSGVLGHGDEQEAKRVAAGVAAALALVTALFVAAGVTLAPQLLYVIAPNFTGEKRELTIVLTRILFPGAGIFVISAWCLGILNSHRRFFLSYAAPVAWNGAMIATLLWAGLDRTESRLAVLLAWGSVAGALLQFGVQLPTVLKLVGRVQYRLHAANENVRRVARNFIPVFVSRGVVQISTYVDLFIANFLPDGMVAMASYASAIYVLPVSLFGMAVSAAELPEMARVRGDAAAIAAALRTRVNTSLRRIAYFVVPSAVAFLILGDVIIAVLLQSGRFGPEATLFTWGVLAGSSIGLLASTLGRLYSSTYYALHDTRTPLRFAMIRLAITAAVGSVLALLAPRWLGIDARWGGAGLTLASSLAGWVEFSLLRSRLAPRIGTTGLPFATLWRLWGAAVLAAVCAVGVQLLLGESLGRLLSGAPHRFVTGGLILATFAAVYGGVTVLLRVPEALSIGARVLRLRPRAR